MTDNYKLIRNLLEFNSKDEFYPVMVLQRKKDAKKGVKVNGTNNNSRLIKAYYVDNLEYFDFIEKEVKELCKLFNARAGVHLNKRSYRRTALQSLKLVTDNIINENYNKVYKTYSSAVGKFSHDNNKKWIVDIDEEDMDDDFLPIEIIAFIKTLKPYGDKYITTLRTKSGIHIITSPFDMQGFKEKYPSLEIKKDNPTNLFIP